MPVTDITGEGDPDVMFLTRFSSFGACCWGTTVYNLGVTPTKVMEVNSVYHWGTNTGQGDFKDLDANGSYEFITNDPMVLLVPCPMTLVPIVFSYDKATHRYVVANSRFPGFYNGLIAQYSADPTTECAAIPTLLYLDKDSEAKAIYDRLYKDSANVLPWSDLQAKVKQGRFYVPAK